MKDTLETVVQGGALGLLALLLGGAIYLAAAVLPSIRSFFEGLTEQLREIGKRQAVMEAKLDAVGAAVVESGKATAGSLGRLGDAVAAEAFEVRQDLGAAERRITAAVRREQASDPPPQSRTSVPTPPTGLRLDRRPVLERTP